jgi:vacuolar-type H+-ATPase catalytic subunit A/Vma1
VEEVFPLRCSAVELEDFLRRSRPHAAGWISFYWGCTAQEYRQQNSLVAAIMADWLDRFQRLGKEFTSP